MLLAKGAVAAQRLLDAGDTAAFSADYLEARITVARFYAEQLLPQVHGLVGAATSGADDLYALSPAQLA
jgi:3-(methylthio)propanoyl-CoA dehydrogenase